MKTERFSLVNQLHVELKGVKSPFAADTIQDYLQMQYVKTFCDGVPTKYFDLTFEVSAFDKLVLNVMSEAILSNFDVESEYPYILDVRVTEYTLRDNEFVPTAIEFDLEDDAAISIMAARTMLTRSEIIDLDAVSVYMSSQWHDHVVMQLDDVTGTDDPQLRTDIDPRWVEFYTTTDPCRDIKYQDAYLSHSWDWRGYCVNNGLTESQAGDLLDLVCWAIDHDKDFDEFILGTTKSQPNESEKTQTINNTTTMEQTNNKPQDWKMAPATPTTDLEQTYKEKFEAAFAIVLDPSSNLTLGDMPRTWSYRGGKNNVIVCTVTDIAELTYEVQFGKRTQYVTHNDVRYNFASVPNMKKALEECFDDEGNATDDIWNYTINKPKAAKTDAPKTAPKAETKTKKKEAAQQTKQTEQPTKMSATLTPTPSDTAETECYDDDKRWYYFYNNFSGGTVISKDDCHIVNNYPKADPVQMRNVVTACKLHRLDKTPDAVIAALVKGGIINTPMSVVANNEPKAEEPTPQPTPTTVEQPKAEQPAEEAPKAEEPKVIPLTLPDTITVGTLKNGSVTLSGLTDLTAEQIAIFVAGMNAMKEAIKKQMAI